MSDEVLEQQEEERETGGGEDAPTFEAYDDLERAYQHLNTDLFGGQLPGALFTFQRNKRFLGYFSRKRFQHADSKVMADEIAMNPAYFAIRPVEAVLSTLAHEMVHQFLAHFGSGGRRGYHNREFADKMKEIGLQTSTTGKPGGKEVGESMTQFILPDGAFIVSVKRLLETDFKLSWLDRFPEQTEYPAYIPTEEELREFYPDEYGAEEGASKEGALPPPLLAPVLAEDGITPADRKEGDDGQASLAAASDHAAASAHLAETSDDGVPRIVLPPKGTQAPLLSQPPSASGSGLDIEFPSPTRKGSKAKTTRSKFVCPACGDAAWGKPGLHLICGKCNTRMPSRDETDDDA